MHVLVPQKIINEYRQGQRIGEFQAIGLFVDISGFSRMTNDLMQLGQHGAEILANSMREIFAPLVNSVYAHGGFIATFAGDAFTALFPFDANPKQAARHAISAAWEIQSRIKEKTLQINGAQVGISTRVGLACGTASWGIVNSEDQSRAVYYFRGAAVENCAEAESLAKAGETIIDLETKALLTSFIQCEEIEEYFRVKDIAELLSPAETPQLTDIDLDISSLFYPRELITQTPSGEFRQTVNMFINLPTVRTEDQLAIFMQYIFKLQDQYGGLLNRIDFGDKGSHLLLFWGAPVAYENDIGRALNFILSLQTDTSIPIKAGITYRIAHAGFIGAPLREEYTCYGQGVNLAARFMTAAPRGEVWIDEAIAKRVSNYFDVEYVDEISLKGFEEKQKVFALYERKEFQDPYYNGEYVGREKDLQALSEFLAPLWQPDYVGAIVITGEAGIGKSRLLNEFLQNAEIFQQHPTTLALCHTDQMLRNSFNPFRYWLRRYFGISGNQIESRNKRSFNQTLDQLIGETRDPQLAKELDRTRSFLAALVDLFWQDSLYEQLDPERRYENTVTGLLSLLKAESLKQPVILHMEDIQWLDLDSKSFFSQLNRILLTDRSQTYPIAIMCTSRSREEEFALSEGLAHQSLNLEPLTKNEITMLTELHLQAPVESWLADYFSTLSEGNPFYAEQILYYMQEEGLIELQEGQWKLKATDSVPTPTDVRTLLVSRIDQFPSEIIDLVQKASILGREFDKSVLLRMAGDDQITNEHIRFLETGFVWAEIAAGKYIFRSNLLKETAYQMQIHTRRQTLHAKAAFALEEIYAEDLKPYYYQLAHHSDLGKLKDKACHYLHKAGQDAYENFQNDQAVAYFTRAYQHTDSDALETRLKILLRRELAYRILGHTQAQKADLDQAKELARQMDSLYYLSEIAVREILLSAAISEYEKVIEQAPAVVALAEKAQRQKLIVSANITWANSLRMTGDYEGGRLRLLVIRQLAEKIGDFMGVSSSLNILGLIEIEQANFSQARRYLEEALNIGEQQDLDMVIAQSLNNLGVIASDQGDYSSASRYYQQALEISQRTGIRLGQGLLTLNVGWLAGIMGDYPTAQEFLANSLRILREIGEGYGVASALINLSLFSWAQGEYSLAQRYAEEGVTRAREIQYRSGEAMGLTFLGHALTGLAKLEEAKTAYQTALEIRQGMEQANLYCEPMAGLGQVALLQSDLAAAGKAARTILVHLDQGGTLDGIDHPHFIRLVCYQTLKGLGESRATAFLQETHDILQAQAEKIQDDLLRQSFLEQVPWHREILQEYQKKLTI